MKNEISDIQNREKSAKNILLMGWAVRHYSRPIQRNSSKREFISFYAPCGVYIIGPHYPNLSIRQAVSLTTTDSMKLIASLL